jgi:beta-xylosidase
MVKALISAGLAMVLAAIGSVDAAAPSGTAAPTFANPVLFADYSDPDVIRSGRDYYLVASSFHLSPGLPVLRSRDLVHWTIVGHVVSRLLFAPQYDLPGPFKMTDAKPMPTEGARYGGGPWAPSLRKHAGRFYVYWPTPDEGVFMATARRPEGPWSAPVKVIDQPGLEDPCPFWDDDGTAWLIHGKVGAGPLVLHRMSPDGTRVLDAGVIVAQDRARLPVLEGPKLYKRHGWYYIFAPIGGVGAGPQAVGRARDIRGPYEWRDVMAPGGPLALKGPHQGGWVETPSGQGWFLHFNAAGAYGRIVYLEPVRWRDDWPVIGEAAPGETTGRPVAGGAYPDTGSPPTHDRLQDSDEFSSPKLGVQWEWIHNPDDRAWSLRERPGFLRLRAGRAEHLVTARNTLTQVLQGPLPSYTARIDISALADGQRAGLTLFGAQPSWIGVVRDHDRTRATLGSAGVETPLAAVQGPWIEFRAAVHSDRTVSYSYSIDDGASFVPAGAPIPLPSYAWWKGARPGFFTFNTQAAAGRIDIDWFRATAGQPASDRQP